MSCPWFLPQSWGLCWPQEAFKVASHWLKQEGAQERQAGDRQSVLHSRWALCQSRREQECRGSKTGKRDSALCPAQTERASVGLSGLGGEVQVPGFPASFAPGAGDISDKR